ncbi:MAG: hypothetical protein JXQ84_02290 [Rhodospirillaceae bacterium]|nr:hypothetical protein [Rhodospirillaceae bacterium]
MVSDAARRGESVVVRLCHDLAGPAGALVNGVELLEMEGVEGFAAEALGLLRASARALTARLEFFRAVFGAPSSRVLKPVVARDTAQAYLGQLGDKARVFVLEAFPDDAETSPEFWRFALLLVFLGVEALPFGGTLAVTVTAGGLSLRVSGRRAAFSEVLRAGLDGADNADPRAVAAALLVARARDAGLLSRAWQDGDLCGVDLVPGGGDDADCDNSLFIRAP